MARRRLQAQPRLLTIPSSGIFNLRSGVNASGESIEIPLSYMRVCENMYVNRDSLIGRGGTQQRWGGLLLRVGLLSSTSTSTLRAGEPPTSSQR